MTKTEFTKMLNGLAAAWAQKDYDKAVNFFADDVRYGDPTRYHFAGKTALLNFFQDDEGYEQRTDWHSILFDPELRMAAVEYTYEGTYRYHGVVLIKISNNNQITHWREYQHISPLAWEEFISSTSFEL
jgi:hypothetical protein